MIIELFLQRFISSFAALRKEMTSDLHEESFTCMRTGTTPLKNNRSEYAVCGASLVGEEMSSRLLKLWGMRSLKPRETHTLDTGRIHFHHTQRTLKPGTPMHASVHGMRHTGTLTNPGQSFRITHGMLSSNTL